MATRAGVLARAINEILDRPGLLSDRNLRDQLRRASDSIVSNIAEGFAQPTDRSFANYLFKSKGSTAEARTQLRLAWNRDYITEQEYHARNNIGDELAAMLTGLIKYLIKSDRRDRGLGPRHPRNAPSRK